MDSEQPAQTCVMESRIGCGETGLEGGWSDQGSCPCGVHEGWTDSRAHAAL